MSANNISKSLGLTPFNDAEDRKRLPAPIEDSDTAEAEADIQNARQGLYRAMEYSRDTVEDLISIARQSQHPKAYEILNSSIKTYADISESIANVQLKKQRLNRDQQNDAEGKRVNNNLFVGSTAELQQMLENMRNKDNDNVEDE